MQRFNRTSEAFSRWKVAWELSSAAHSELNARIAAASAGRGEPPPAEAYANANALTREADRLLLIASHLLHDLAPGVKGSHPNNTLPTNIPGQVVGGTAKPFTLGHPEAVPLARSSNNSRADGNRKIAGL